jgi:glycosyltransferase involved in cell wall biosynthesis
VTGTAAELEDAVPLGYRRQVAHDGPPVSLVIPVFNGRGFILDSLALARDHLGRHFDSFELVVVDDGSTDGTGAVVDGLDDDLVRLLTLPRNRGKFAALRAGMAAARGACRIFTDADLPYDLEALPYIVSLVNRRGYHLVVGDRTLADSDCHLDLPLPRRIATSWFRFVVRVLVTGGLHDTQCGLKGVRGDVAVALFPLLSCDGFAGDVELLYVALKYNLEIRRIPVRLRREAPSTVRLLSNAPAMLRSIARLRSNWMTQRYRSETLLELAAQRYWEETGGAPHAGREPLS